jgi:hypothetical protein
MTITPQDTVTFTERRPDVFACKRGPIFLLAKIATYWFLEKMKGEVMNTLLDQILHILSVL